MPEWVHGYCNNCHKRIEACNHILLGQALQWHRVNECGGLSHCQLCGRKAILYPRLELDGLTNICEDCSSFAEEADAMFSSDV